MATTENINAMISSYERIDGEYSFKNFMQSANIKKGTYACINELLLESKKAITVNLTAKQNLIQELERIRDDNSNRVNLGCADSITENMTISKIEEIYGELCQQKDEKGNRLWLTEDGNLEGFWGKKNKEQLDNYDQLSKYLAEVNGPRLSFRLVDFTDDDVRKSISTFFDLIKHNQEVVDYIDELLSVIGSMGHISTKSVDKLLNCEETLRFIAKSVVSTVKPESFNKIENIRYNYNEIRQISNQDNANYADILNKVINSLLNEGSKRSHFWSNILKFLNILRLLRNALGHYKKDLVEEGEQLPVACFILHSYVGTFLAITKNMQNQHALLPYDERQKTLTVYYKQDLNKENFRDDKGGELSIEEEEEILKNLPKPRLFREEEVEPFDVSNGCAKYPIYPMESDDQHYTIRWREGDSAVEAKVPNDKLWKSASSEPVAILNGVKYYFFTDLSNVYAELDPYIQNAQKKDVEALAGLVKTLNSMVSNMESSTDANTEVIIGLKDSVEKIDGKLSEISNKLDGIIEEQRKGNKIQTETGQGVKTLVEIEKDKKEKEEKERENNRKKAKEKKKNQFLFIRCGVAIFTIVVSIGWLLYNTFGVNHNLWYLENNWLYFVIPIILAICGLGIFFSHLNNVEFSGKRQKMVDYSCVALSLLLSIIPFVINKGPEKFIADYGFSEYDSIYNQKVVAYMERYVVTHKDADEVARMRLADYYMIAGDGANALRIIEPMKDVNHYKEGCAIAAEALYRFQKSRSEVWRIVESYKMVYRETPPVSLQYLEGIMLFKGEGNMSKIKEGFDILKRLADSGYDRAQFDVGYYLCNIRVDKQNKFALIDITDSNDHSDVSVGGNLLEAADYLRQAASHLPEAAVELGSLYADLAMEDSAMTYLNRVTDGFYKHTPDTLLCEAYYQKALFYFTIQGNDSIAYTFLNEAVNRNYPKAALYDAFLKDDPSRAVDIYNGVPNSQNVQGYSRYIPPVVFDYLSLGIDSLAFKKLVTSRPHGRFNMDFVIGMKYFLRSEISRKSHLSQQAASDSIQAMDYMKRSAYGDNSCLYARMICAYYDAKSSLGQGRYPIGLIKELHEIAKEIPFAYILEGYLRAFNDNGDYAQIEEASIRAMGEKHPAGAYLLTFMPGGYVEQVSKLINGNNKNKDKEELSKKSIMMQAGLRQTNRALKPYLLYTVYCLDRECDAKVRELNFIDDKNKYYNIKKMHFWADVAIANHAYYLETQLLPLAHVYEDETYSRKLIEASLRDFPGISRDTLKETRTIAFGGYPWETQSLQVLASFIKAMPNEYVKSLEQKYKKDLVRNIFFSVDFVKKDVSPAASPELYEFNLPLLGQISFMGLDTEDTGYHLLNEFSDIGKNIWKLDLHLENK